MRVQRCKGSRDLSPEEMRGFRLIEGVFRDCCLKRGYEEVRTPTLEYLHLFTSTGTLTPSRLGKVYSFLDWDGWSGERVVLRPDGTIPIARLYIDTMAEKELAKLFYVTNVFIFEETGKETREKWQCGAELIGAGSTIADVELVILALEVLKKLGLKDDFITAVEIKKAHRKTALTCHPDKNPDTPNIEQKFDEINAGFVYPAKYDRRHDISLTLMRTFNEKWSGSAIFIYISGNAFTMPVGRYIIQGNIVNQYGDINSFRMPPYHRMDVSMTRKIITTKNWSSELIFSIYNIYSRANPYFIYFEATGDLEKYSLEIKAVEVSLFPLIPSVSWSFKF